MPIRVVPIRGLPAAHPSGPETGAATPARRTADVAATAQAIEAVPGGVRLTFPPVPGVRAALERAVARARQEGTCLRFVIDGPSDAAGRGPRGGPRDATITLTILGPPTLAG